MSGAQHTPGRLNVKRGQFGSSVFVIYGADGFPIVQTISNSSPEGMERARRGEHEANARRLAAAWNACLHIPIEVLEACAEGLPADAIKALMLVKAAGPAALDAAGSEQERLRASNAELLAALKEAELFIRVLGLDSEPAAAVAASCRATIARATGGAV
jgi:hypothetical protein